MAGRFGPTFPCTLLVVLAILLIVLADHSTSETRCRFASKSESRGSCIFPCRCTDGCDPTTGDCLNGGHCNDGHPNGYQWGGTACQTGNVGYGKRASQSPRKYEKWSFNHPASGAVDGNTDPDIDHNSCAHPTAPRGTNAWWMVDLGKTYRIYRVIIYNRKSSLTPWKRLDTFILSVGNSPDSLTQCSSHAVRVPPSGSVNKSCPAVGRYLRFTRNGGFENHLAGLCEVVIFGHLFFDCQQTYCSSTCDDVIGCDACVPGRQQPDCKKVCDEGTYGVNCQNDCGHCKSNSACNVVNGRCAKGCEDWYITDVCKTNIPTPHFGILRVPDVDVINSSSAVVRWPKANDIPSGLEFYYYYAVWLQVDGETDRKVAHVLQGADVDQLESSFSGLVFNTHYSVKIEAYRQHNEKHEGGAITDVTRFRTSCIAPTTPVITTVTKSTTSIVVMWQTITGTGCDEIVAVGVWYTRPVSPSEGWFYRGAKNVNLTKLDIDVLKHDLYVITVTFTNNENMSSSSKGVVVDLRTSEAVRSTSVPVTYLRTSTNVFPTTSIPDKTCRCAASGSAAAVLGTGLVIIVAVATFLLGVLLSAVVMLAVLRMRSIKANTAAVESQRERPSTGNESVMDDQDYVVIPRVPGEQEDEIQDESGYIHPAAVPRQQNQPNVYDVITPTA